MAISASPYPTFTNGAVLTAAQLNAMIRLALPVSGGTELGPLYLASDPVLPGQAATKRYVDAQIAALRASLASSQS